MDELNNFILEYKINKEDICIVGSGVLAYFSLRDNKDIDIILKKSVRLETIKTLNTFQISDYIEAVKFGWAPNEKLSDDLIIEDKNYHFIDLKSGFKFVKLELVLAKKEYIKRDKDIEDMNLMRQYFLNNNINKELYNKSIKKYNFFQKIKNRLRPYYKKFKELKDWTYCGNSDMLIMQHTDKLLSYQYKDNKFNRYDIIVRYLAIEEFFGKNSFGFDLYKKMQMKRGYIQRIDHKDNGDSLEKFKSLIENIEKNGFDECSLIPVDKNQSLIDGSHRFAVALYFNIKLLPLKLNRYKFDTDYSLNWFKNNDFNNEEISLIENKKNEIFYENGIYFQIVLWPPIQKYFYEIEKDIKRKYKVLNSYEIDFKNSDAFKNFVFAVYESDDIEAWKIEKKLKGFGNYNSVVKVIEIEIINPRFRRKNLNNQDISQEVEAIKKEYRSKYSNKIENYFYDIIMHIGDNYHHTREIAKVIRKFKNA